MNRFLIVMTIINFLLLLWLVVAATHLGELLEVSGLVG